MAGLGSRWHGADIGNHKLVMPQIQALTVNL